jgi:1,4-dihydroxy-2-naphthoate octaprenyltransferase
MSESPSRRPPIRPGSLAAWILAARPPTLPAAIVPVLVGTAPAAAIGKFDAAIFIITLLTALLLQIGANLANDYFDFLKGADTGARLGPTRVTQGGLLAPRAIGIGLVSIFGAASVLGGVLVWSGGWPIAMIGSAAILAALAYTAGPYPLAYHGLGNVAAFGFFGIAAVVGTSWLQLGSIPPEAWLASLAVGALVTNILVVNNLRDHDTDAAAGKRTTTVRFGRGFARTQYVVLLGFAYSLPVTMAVLGLAGWGAAALPLLALPLARAPLRAVLTQQGRPLNRALMQTARLHMAFGALFAIGLLR